MDEELGGTFVVSVEELGINGLWSTIKDVSSCSGALEYVCVQACCNPRRARTHHPTGRLCDTHTHLLPAAATTCTQLVEARMPLHGVTLPNKVGKHVQVAKLPLMCVWWGWRTKRALHVCSALVLPVNVCCVLHVPPQRAPRSALARASCVMWPHAPTRPACRFVLSHDKRLLRLKQYSHSPVTWFRNPSTHLVLVSRVRLLPLLCVVSCRCSGMMCSLGRGGGGGSTLAPGAGQPPTDAGQQADTPCTTPRCKALLRRAPRTATHPVRTGVHSRCARVQERDARAAQARDGRHRKGLGRGRHRQRVAGAVCAAI
jgi:hypothetical protein